MLEANLRVLKARFPVVYDRILAVGDRQPDNFHYEEQEGIQINDPERRAFLSSLR